MIYICFRDMYKSVRVSEQCCITECESVNSCHSLRAGEYAD